MSTTELSVSEENVRQLAYSIWMEEGCPDGRAEAHWFEALRRASVPVPAKSKKPVVRKITVRSKH